MDNQSKVGVVTVTYNSAGVIHGFMRSLLSQTHEKFILYVVDNCSTDTTLALVHEYSDHRIRVIANQENVGVAAGNNQGISLSLEAGCDYVLLINNDTVFGVDLLKILLDRIVLYHSDMIVPKIMYHDQPEKIWCAGGWFNPHRAYSGYHYGDGEFDVGQYDIPKQVEYSPTCCMLIDREIFSLIGVMDEKYFVYYDDVDFCYRALQKGCSLYYTPDVKLLHKVSSLTGGESLFSIRYVSRNRAYFIKKNLFFLEKIRAFAYCQGWFFYRLIRKYDKPTIFMLRQSSFWSGLKM